MSCWLQLGFVVTVRGWYNIRFSDLILGLCWLLLGVLFSVHWKFVVVYWWVIGLGF